MVNYIFALRWVKNIAVRNQSYELAAWCRDMEKISLDEYNPDWRNVDIYKIVDEDPEKSMSKQYHILLQMFKNTHFIKNYNHTKFNIEELTAKEFIQVVREENLNKLLE